LYYQMFFTLTYEFHFRSIIKGYPTGQWVFRSNGFVPQIQAKYFIPRMGYDPADNQGSGFKLLFGSHILVPFAPINEGSRAAFYVHPSDMDREGRRTSRHDGESIPQFLKFPVHFQNGTKSLIAFTFSFVQINRMDVSVVHVQSYDPYSRKFFYLLD